MPLTHESPGEGRADAAHGELLLPLLDADADRAGDALQDRLVAGNQEWTRRERGESWRGAAEASKSIPKPSLKSITKPQPASCARS